MKLVFTLTMTVTATILVLTGADLVLAALAYGMGPVMDALTSGRRR